MQTTDVPKQPFNDSVPVAMPIKGGHLMVPPKSIVHCRAAGNYTHIFLSTGKEAVICKRLKEVEALLPDMMFYRPHHSYLVNLSHVEMWVREGGGYLRLTDGEKVPVARLRKNNLKSRLKVG